MAEKNTPLRIIQDEATGNRFVAYTNKDGVALEVRFDDDQPWFTQVDLASTFGVTVQAVNQHIQVFAAAGELDSSTIKDFLIVRTEGNREIRRPITHYGLDVAFYVGYRVNSAEGKLFRRWATTMLVQLATKGFVVDVRRLKGDHDRLRELRELIRDIRADEANLYVELRRILSMCSDYDPSSKTCIAFFAKFQNTLLYAITEHTAPELLVARADARKANMGLTNWKGDHLLQCDVGIAKNYLGQLELQDLNRLVGMVLDFFEDQVERGWLVSTADADAKLGEILAVNKRLKLSGAGSVSHSRAEKHAKDQYAIFDEKRREVRKASALRDLNAAIEGVSKGPRKQPAKKTKPKPPRKREGGSDG
jgi:hypothetical protein